MQNILLYVNGTEEDILGVEETSRQIGMAGMFLCLEGEVEFTINDIPYTMRPNSMVVYMPYSLLHVVRKSNDLRGILVSINLDESQQIIGKVSNFDRVLDIKQSPAINLTEEQKSHILELIDSYIHHIEEAEKKKHSSSEDKNITNMQVELLRDCLALEIIKCYPEPEGKKKSHKRQDEILKRFVFLLYANYRKEHSVGFYASKLCITSRYFSNVIHERSGRTPSQWINNALLTECKKLLCETNMSVKEISDYLHFPNQSYFGKWIKNITGQGPLQLRNGNKKT